MDNVEKLSKVRPLTAQYSWPEMTELAYLQPGSDRAYGQMQQTKSEFWDINSEVWDKWSELREKSCHYCYYYYLFWSKNFCLKTYICFVDNSAYEQGNYF